MEGDSGERHWSFWDVDQFPPPDGESDDDDHHNSEASPTNETDGTSSGGIHGPSPGIVIENASTSHRPDSSAGLESRRSRRLQQHAQIFGTATGAGGGGVDGALPPPTSSSSTSNGTGDADSVRIVRSVPNFSDVHATLIALLDLLRAIRSTNALGDYVVADRVVFHIRHVWLNSLHYVQNPAIVDLLADICDSWYLSDVGASDECVNRVERALRELSPAHFRRTVLRRVFDALRFPLGARLRCACDIGFGLVSIILCAVFLGLGSNASSATRTALVAVVVGLLVVSMLVAVMQMLSDVAPWSVTQAVHDFEMLSVNPLSSLRRPRPLARDAALWERYDEGFVALKTDPGRYLLVPVEEIMSRVPLVVIGPNRRISFCSSAFCRMLDGGGAADATISDRAINLLRKDAADVFSITNGGNAAKAAVKVSLRADSSTFHSTNGAASSVNVPNQHFDAKVVTGCETLAIESGGRARSQGDQILIMSPPPLAADLLSGSSNTARRDGGAATFTAAPPSNLAMVSFEKTDLNAPQLLMPSASPHLPQAASLRRRTVLQTKIGTAGLAAKLRGNPLVTAVQLTADVPSHLPAAIDTVIDDLMNPLTPPHAVVIRIVSEGLAPRRVRVTLQSSGGNDGQASRSGRDRLAASNSQKEASTGWKMLAQSTTDLLDKVRGLMLSIDDTLVDFVVPLDDDGNEHSTSTDQRSSIGFDATLHILVCSGAAEEAARFARIAIDCGHSFQLCKTPEQVLRLSYSNSASFDIAVWHPASLTLTKAMLEIINTCCRGTLFVQAAESIPPEATALKVVRIAESLDEEGIESFLTRVASTSAPDASMSLAGPASPASKPHGTILVKRKLGSGAFGDVYEAVLEPTGGVVALKKIEIGGSRPEIQRNLSNIMKEIGIMSKLSHPNIVRYLFTEREHNTINIAMELCDDSLEGVLKRGPAEPRQIFKWMRELVMAVQYLHENRIIHRDIKTGNIYLRKGVLKVGDFGSAARDVAVSGVGSLKGTIAYASPESLLEEPYGPPCDIWSVGAVFARLLGIELHRDTSFYHLANLYRSMPMDSGVTVSSEMPPNIAHVLQSCLQRDPARRLTATQLLALPLLNDEALLCDEISHIPREGPEGSVFNMSLASDSSARPARESIQSQ